MKTLVVGITGASGSIYAVRLIEELVAREYHVHVVLSDTGLEVVLFELEGKIDDYPLAKAFLTKDAGSLPLPRNLSIWDPSDFRAPFASGSNPPDAMIVVPCSMGTVAGIACGEAGNLLRRAADVVMKEGRKLLLVPRETPLNAIHLENMLKLARMGVTILPAMPGFYHRPRTVTEVVDFVVARILDQLAIPHTLAKRWGE